MNKLVPAMILLFAVWGLNGCYKEENADQDNVAMGTTRTEFELDSDGLKRMEDRYKNGDSEAALSISYHYMVTGDYKKYEEWAEKSFRLKNAEAGELYLSLLSSKGHCEAFRRNIKIYKEMFPSESKSIEAHFKEPPLTTQC